VFDIVIAIALFCLISDSAPVCGPVVSRSSVVENEAVDFTCSMTYRWHSGGRSSNIFPNINASFGWADDSESPSTRMLTLETASEQTVVQTMTVAGAKKPEIPAQNCTLSFTFTAQPAQPHLATRYSFAVNPVSYTCSSAPIPVRRTFLLDVLHIGNSLAQ